MVLVLCYFLTLTFSDSDLSHILSRFAAVVSSLVVYLFVCS